MSQYEWQQEENRLINRITFADALCTLQPKDRAFAVDFFVKEMIHEELRTKYRICSVTIRKRVARILKHLEIYLGETING